MTGHVAEIWRFPIKSHGREALQSVPLEAGKTMPWDRAWAVAHEASKADGSEWARCANFTRVAGAPELAAISARLDDAAQTLTLRHPRRPDLEFWPDDQPQDLIDWVRPLMPENRAAPTHLVRVPGRGLTDSAYPSVSLANFSSHRAVEQKLGRDLSIHRWRGNIWLDGLGPWEEFEWLGRDIRIGSVLLRVVEPARRCETTLANPETGKRDADILGTLEHWGHRDFTVLAEVIEGAELHVGDKVELA